MTIDLDVTRFLQQSRLAVSADTDQTLIYRLELTFPRSDYNKHGFSNGFVLGKKFSNMDSSDRIKVGDIVKVDITINIDDYSYRYIALDDPLPAGLVAVNSALKTEEPVEDADKYGEDEYFWYYWDPEGYYRFVPSYFEIRDDRVLVFVDNTWKGLYRYSYYARAVCAGVFVVPPTQIQLMYSPEIRAFTPEQTIVIEDN